jgi:ankyrin repeat protein
VSGPGIGEPPLLYAARRGQEDEVRRLLQEGADVDAQDMAEGRGALLSAVLGAHLEVARLLLSAGARLDRMDHQGVMAAEAASRSRSVRGGGAKGERAQALWDEVEAAIEAALSRAPRAPGAAAEAALRLAAAEGRAAQVAEFLSAGARADAPDPWNTSALGFAALRGHAALIGPLLKAGADPARRTRRQLYFDRLELHSPLGWAVLRGHAAVVAALAAHGVPIDLPDPWGDTPLMVAARHNRAEVIEALLSAGANLAHRNRRGQRAADIAQASGHAALAQRLQPA